MTNKALEQFNLPPSSKLRLSHLAMHRMINNMQKSVEEMDTHISKTLDKLTSSPSNSPSGDSTRTASMTELDIVARTAASIKMVTFAPTPSLLSFASASSNIRDFYDYDEEEEVEGLNENISNNMINGSFHAISKPPVSPTATPAPMPIAPKRSSYETRRDLNFNGKVGSFEEMVLRNMVGARDYLMRTLQGSTNLLPVTHETSQIIRSGSLEQVKSSILNFRGDGEILDFRTLNGYPRSLPPSPVYSTSEFEEKPIDIHLFTPPNEFDWFSKDNMGEVFSSTAACHLFTTLKSSTCASKLCHLYINGNRMDYSDDGGDEESLQFTSIAETLTDLTQIKKLVLRGLCDDTMLKCIGQSMNHLEYLDVSGSQLVTNAGIQNLVFKNPVLNSAFYLIPAWIAKNVDKLNPLVHTITYLDHSWTSVSSMGRKIVQLLPGNYLFRRLMYLGNQDPVGHHVFIREQSCFQSGLSNLNPQISKEFVMKCSEFLGLRGIKHFLSIVENHPWKTCHLTIYSTRFLNLNGQEEELETIIEEERTRTSDKMGRVHYGILTPNQNEKRIQGLVHWDENGNLTELYTIYPMNINALGNLTNLHHFRGIVNDTWRTQFSILPDLTQLDIFTEPSTLINIIQFCPNLKIIRVRIRTMSLTDSPLIKAIQSSMSRRSLEEFWIAPGSHMETTLRSNMSSATNLKAGESMDEMPPTIASIDDLRRSLSLSEFHTSELIQISLDCLDVIIDSCPKLKKVGDLALWINVREEDFYAYTEEFKKRNNRVTIAWGNMNFPVASEN